MLLIKKNVWKKRSANTDHFGLFFSASNVTEGFTDSRRFAPITNLKTRSDDKDKLPGKREEVEDTLRSNSMRDPFLQRGLVIPRGQTPA